MADKEFLLLTKARELLVYTRKKTKPINSDVAADDVRRLLHRIACLDDLDKVRQTCEDAANAMHRKKRAGFSKAAYRDFGQDMRDITKDVLRNVFAANNLQFQTEYEKRIALTGRVVDDLALLLEYIKICQDSGIIDARCAGAWTGKVVEVKRMAASWRANSIERAERLRTK